MEKRMKVFNKNVRNGTTVFAMLMAAMLAWAFTVASDAQATDPGSHSELAYVAHLYPVDSKVTGSARRQVEWLDGQQK